MLDHNLFEVSIVIDTYATAHLSSQGVSHLEAAIKNMHAQNLVLLKISDEEQLVVDEYIRPNLVKMKKNSKKLS
jgi:anti-anti-sigma regulatory factor